MGIIIILTFLFRWLFLPLTHCDHGKNKIEAVFLSEVTSTIFLLYIIHVIGADEKFGCEACHLTYLAVCM